MARFKSGEKVVFNRKRVVLSDNLTFVERALRFIDTNPRPFFTIMLCDEQCLILNEDSNDYIFYSKYFDRYKEKVYTFEGEEYV